MLLRTITISLATVGAIAAFSPVAAGDMHTQSEPSNTFAVTHTLTVSYADLDVSHEPGAKALLSRIKTAAATVCAPAPPSALDLTQFAAYKTCMSSAIASGVQSSNQPLVSQLYHSGSAGTTASTSMGN